MAMAMAMAILKVLLLSFALFLCQTNAHFLLNYPPSLGFDQNKEGSSPCGGATIAFTSTTSFHVSGDAIGLTTLHPQSNILYRATKDQTATGNWTVLALITEYGLGAFCEPALTVPASWVGSTGLVQVAQNAEDGVHYQCAAVTFVAGVSSSIPSACKNASGVSAAFASDATLLPATILPTATGSTAATATLSSTTTPPSASATKTSWAVETVGHGVGQWVGVVAGSVMAALLLG